MKKFNELDGQFDKALERLDFKKKPLVDAYGLDPLASNHDLLKKGWAYFHERLSIEEEQWKKILSAKEEQLKILNEQVVSLNSQLEALLQKEKTDSSIEAIVTDLHLGEYVDVKKKTEQIREKWNEERQTWFERCQYLEMQMKNLQDEGLKRSATFSAREAELLSKLRALEDRLAKQMEEALLSNRKTLAALKSKDDDISSLITKADLAQAHADRLMIQLKELDEEKNQILNQSQQQKAEIAARNEQLVEKEREIEHLKSSLEIKQKEVATLRSDMARQQAEWREWWAKIQSQKSSV